MQSKDQIQGNLGKFINIISIYYDQIRDIQTLSLNCKKINRYEIDLYKIYLNKIEPLIFAIVYRHESLMTDSRFEMSDSLGSLIRSNASCNRRSVFSVSVRSFGTFRGGFSLSCGFPRRPPNKSLRELESGASGTTSLVAE